MVGLAPKWVRLAPNGGAKCTEIWSEKVPDLSHLGQIWPTLEPNLPSLPCLIIPLSQCFPFSFSHFYIRAVRPLIAFLHCLLLFIRFLWQIFCLILSPRSRFPMRLASYLYKITYIFCQITFYSYSKEHLSGCVYNIYGKFCSSQNVLTLNIPCVCPEFNSFSIVSSTSV